jgi:hypothetical protein
MLMDNPFSGGLAWYRYKRLQEEFINATQYFPFEQKHKAIWSEFFSDLLTKVCSSIDGFFRKMVEDSRFDSFSHVSVLKSSKRKHDINYFRDFFDPIYQLSTAKVKIEYGLTSYGTCRHFKGFLDPKNNRIPSWWNSYNHVKHGWYVNIKEATLKNTIEALAGLFVLNVLHKESQEYLIKHQDVITGEFLDRMPQDMILEAFNRSMIGIPEARNQTCIAKTSLFMHIFRVDKQVTPLSKYSVVV